MMIFHYHVSFLEGIFCVPVFDGFRFASIGILSRNYVPTNGGDEKTSIDQLKCREPDGHRIYESLAINWMMAPKSLPSWWLNQPIWKNMLVKLEIIPRDRGGNKKDLKPPASYPLVN